MRRSTPKLMMGAAVIVLLAFSVFLLAVKSQMNRAIVAVQGAAGELNLNLAEFSGPTRSGLPFVNRAFHWQRRSAAGVDLLDYLFDEELVCWTSISLEGAATSHGCVNTGASA